MPATIETTTTEFETVADLLDRLGGDVPPERIRLVPTPGTATDADLVRLNENPLRTAVYELVDGTLVEKAKGYWEGLIAATLVQILRTWVDEHGAHAVNGTDGMIRLTGRTTRIPDVPAVSRSQFPNVEPPERPNPDLYPNLAIEVLSRSSRPGEMRRKHEDYFSAGASLVWGIDPPKRTIAVYTSPDEYTTLSEDDSIDGAPVFPGFSITLREILTRAKPGPSSADSENA